MVEIYSNRVEISNPGEPIVPVERFIDGYQSRNERLADMMRRMGICEEKSSGIDRVVQAAEVYQLPAPDFRSIFRRTSVTIFGPRQFERDGPQRPSARLLPALRPEVGDVAAHDQPVAAGAFPPAVRTEAAIASQVIAATIEAGPDQAGPKRRRLRKFARYLPFWA